MFIRIVCIAVISIFCYTGIGISEELNNSDTNTVENTAFGEIEDNFSVTLNGDLLSVSAIDVPLEIVMREVVRISGINVWMMGGDTERITIEFNDVLLRNGVERILKDRDYGFFYDQNPDQSGNLQIVGQEQNPPDDPIVDSNIDPSLAEKPAGPYRKYNRIIRVSGPGLPKRHFSKEMVLDYMMSNVDILRKHEVMDFLGSVDIGWFTNTMARIISTHIPNVSPEEIINILEILKTSGDPGDNFLDEIIMIFELLTEPDDVWNNTS